MHYISAKDLKQLKKYPDDDHIKGIIHKAYKQATALAKDILGMIISDNIAFQPEIFTKFENTNNLYISFAAKEIKKREKLNFSDNSNDDFIEAYNSLSMLLNSNYTFSYNSEFMIGIVNNQ
ncbi:4478_t:CDS:2 [Funneliformis geosporum]|nr:4478_t:CDS:2 [Funneliformis geosporum]